MWVNFGRQFGFGKHTAIFSTVINGLSWIHGSCLALAYDSIVYTDSLIKSNDSQVINVESGSYPTLKTELITPIVSYRDHLNWM